MIIALQAPLQHYCLPSRASNKALFEATLRALSEFEYKLMLIQRYGQGQGGKNTSFLDLNKSL